MNEKRKKEIVSMLKEPHKETLKNIAKDNNKKVRNIVERFCETYDLDETEEGYGDDKIARINYATRVVKGEVAHEKSKPIHELEFLVIGVGNLREGQRKSGKGRYRVANFTAIAKTDENENKVIEVQGWGKEADVANSVDFNLTYKVRAERKDTHETHDEYELGSYSNLSELDDFSLNLDDKRKALKNYAPLIDVADAREHIAQGRNDKRLIKAVIQDVTILDSSNGPLGRLEVYDESIPSDQPSEGLFTVMCTERLLRYGPPSEVFFVGRVRYSDQHGLSMWADAIVPIVKSEYVSDFSQVDESEVSEDDAMEVAPVIDDEEVKEEDKFETLI